MPRRRRGRGAAGARRGCARCGRACRGRRCSAWAMPPLSAASGGRRRRAASRWCPRHLPRCALAAQGARPAPRWPRRRRCPSPTCSFDRVLLVHGLEHAENARRLLREVWRVLKDDGRLLVVAPNRLGHLGAYGPHALRPWPALVPRAAGGAAARHMFAVERRDAALFVPPFQARALLRGAGMWERVGRAAWPGLAGVTLTEASKDCFAALPALAGRPRGGPRCRPAAAGAGAGAQRAGVRRGQARRRQCLRPRSARGGCAPLDTPRKAERPLEPACSPSGIAGPAITPVPCRGGRA